MKTVTLTFKFTFFKTQNRLKLIQNKKQTVRNYAFEYVLLYDINYTVKLV